MQEEMNLLNMPCRTILLLFLLAVITNSQDEGSRLIAELQLADLELQDDCENLATLMKSSIIENDYKKRIGAQKTHGYLLKRQSNTLKIFDPPPFEVQKNWTYLVKSGDTLLEEQDWNDLVSYYNGNEELMHTIRVHCTSEQEKCPLIKTGYEKILQDTKNETILKAGWSAWQSLLTLRRNNFPNIVNLVQKAALQNEQMNSKSYWEMLVDFEDAYEKADSLWAEIQPLYLKLQNFVKTRIFNFYNIQSNGSFIPVYLLGSNFGYDWSYIADTVLPDPLIHHNAKTCIGKMPIQDIFKLGETLTQQLSLGTLGDNFWKNSLFNRTFCENNVLSFCLQEHSELLTCDKTSWVTYLDAFEVAVDIALRNIDYLTLSRFHLRHSIIDEAIKSLGSVLAITNMRHNGILDKNLFSSKTDNSNELTELLLTALRVLPKLPFYLIADKWRLHLLENGFQNMHQSWWQFRKDFQGIEGISNNESDFLGEPNIISNKPYISKFFGIVLQFQLLQYYKLYMTDSKDNIASQIGADENFLKMISERSSDDWQYLISVYYGISDLSASSLLDYFQPLEEYLESAPLEQQKIPNEAPTTAPNIVEVETVKIKFLKASPKEEQNKSDIVISANTEEHHKHINENLEGPNPTMEKIGMYVGLGLLGAVAAILLLVIVSKKLARKKRTNNRRFET